MKSSLQRVFELGECFYDTKVVHKSRGLFRVTNSGLFISSSHEAGDLNLLKKFEIEVVISLFPPPKIFKEIRHYYMFLQDSTSERFRIFEHLQEVCPFVVGCLNESRNVLIHCRMGRSRSGSFVLGSMMYLKHMRGEFVDSHKEFLDLKKISPEVHPNRMFLDDLLLYEELLNYSLHKRNGTVKWKPLGKTRKISFHHFYENFIKVWKDSFLHSFNLDANRYCDHSLKIKKQKKRSHSSSERKRNISPIWRTFASNRPNVLLMGLYFRKKEHENERTSSFNLLEDDNIIPSEEENEHNASDSENEELYGSSDKKKSEESLVKKNGGMTKLLCEHCCYSKRDDDLHIFFLGHSFYDDLKKWIKRGNEKNEKEEKEEVFLFLANPSLVSGRRSLDSRTKKLKNKSLKNILFKFCSSKDRFLSKGMLWVYELSSSSSGRKFDLGALLQEFPSNNMKMLSLPGRMFDSPKSPPDFFQCLEGGKIDFFVSPKKKLISTSLSSVDVSGFLPFDFFGDYVKWSNRLHAEKEKEEEKKNKEEEKEQYPFSFFEKRKDVLKKIDEIRDYFSVYAFFSTNDEGIEERVFFNELLKICEDLVSGCFFRNEEVSKSIQLLLNYCDFLFRRLFKRNWKKLLKEEKERNEKEEENDDFFDDDDEKLQPCKFYFDAFSHEISKVQSILKIWEEEFKRKKEEIEKEIEKENPNEEEILNNKVDDYQEEESNMNKKMKKMEEEMEKLSSKNEIDTDKKQILGEEIKKLSSEYEKEVDMEEKLKKMEEVFELQKKRDGVDMIINERQKKIKELLKKKDELQKKKDELQKKKDELQKRVNDLQDDYKRREEEKKTKVEEIEKEYNSLKKKRKFLLVDFCDVFNSYMETFSKMRNLRRDLLRYKEDGCFSFRCQFRKKKNEEKEKEKQEEKEEDEYSFNVMSENHQAFEGYSGMIVYDNNNKNEQKALGLVDSIFSSSPSKGTVLKIAKFPPFEKIHERMKEIEGKYERKLNSDKIIELQKDCYYKGKLIGEGGFGLCFEGILYKKYDVVLKQLRNKDKKLDLLKECKVMQKLYSVYIPKIYGVCLSEFEVIMERMDSNVNDFIMGKKISLGEKLEIMQKMAECVHHLLSKDILHRDLKPANFLISRKREELIVKISDFGTLKSLITSRTTSYPHGTLYFMHPDVVKCVGSDVFNDASEYSFKTELYSLGLSFFNILFEKVAFSEYGNDEKKVREMIIKKEFRQLYEKDFDEFEKLKANVNMKDLIVKLVEGNITIDELMNWFEREKKNFKNLRIFNFPPK